MGDRILLEQILLNLTKNGFEAMAHLEPAQRRLDIVIEHEGADSSLISVRVLDRGHGLASGVDVATSSFSTTKPEGMGMGLAVCRTALEFMGSRLLYSHVPGVGTEFGFSLRAAGSRIVELV
jgi:two-component system sensor histidine kinase DctS